MAFGTHVPCVPADSCAARGRVAIRPPPRTLALAASTLHRVLQRLGVSRLSDLDGRSGRVVRRITTSRPGELVHLDVKKQAKIPPGGGWRVHGRGQAPGRRRRGGYAHVHSAVDAYSRLAYSEIHANEQATTAIGFWRRARAFFATYGITVERVMTDNGSCYVSRAF
jgi:Integrase core domain